jgi:hypothetical protein
MADDSSEIVKEQSESVAAANLKVLADTPAYMAGLAYQIALDGVQGWRTINQASVGKIIDQLTSTSAEEGVTPTTLAGILSKNLDKTPPVST